MTEACKGDLRLHRKTDFIEQVEFFWVECGICERHAVFKYPYLKHTILPYEIDDFWEKLEQLLKPHAPEKKE